jgi:hypothetical protein
MKKLFRGGMKAYERWCGDPKIGTGVYDARTHQWVPIADADEEEIDD